MIVERNKKNEFIEYLSRINSAISFDNNEMEEDEECGCFDSFEEIVNFFGNDSKVKITSIWKVLGDGNEYYSLCYIP